MLLTATWLYLVLAVIAAILIAGFQYLWKNKKKSQLIYWLFFLRFLTIFIILALIINPIFLKKNLQILKPDLFVAVDNSASINYLGASEKVKNLIISFKKNVDLNKKFNIHYYSFGSELSRLDSLHFNDHVTDLSLPFQQFSSTNQEASAPLVIISDGNQNFGKSIEYENYDSPVFPFIVGDTSVLEELEISRINIHKYTSLHNNFPVEIFVNYNGKSTIEKELTIYKKSKKVYTKLLKFGKNNRVNSIMVHLKAEEEGIQFYTAQIEHLSKEKNTQNNSKEFSIEVLNKASEILIVSEFIHPDLGALKKSIESDKEKKVTIIKPNEFTDNLNSYNLIIFYQPTNKFKSVFEKVVQQKRNYFVISGNNTDWNFLNEVQSNFSKRNNGDEKEFFSIFNKNYKGYVAKDIGFDKFPPLEDKMGTLELKVPSQVLLYQKSGFVNQEKQPMLFAFETNNQKCAVLLGENSWKWRAQTYLNYKSFQPYDEFISNLIQYLSSVDSKNRLTISVKPLYFSGENIKISASYLDKNYHINTSAKLWLKLSGRDNFSKNISFNQIDKGYEVEITNLPTGIYNYKVFAEGDAEEVQGVFKILPFEIEQQFTFANPFIIQKIADNTEGKVFYESHEKELIDALINDERFKSIQKLVVEKKPIIDWTYLLGIIILLLSVEWFTRKYVGKI